MAFEFASFVTRNPKHITKHWRKAWSTRKALLTHRKAFPVCAYTGSTKDLQVHHIIPVSVRPDLAGDPDNLITLTRRAHWLIGHGGRSWKHFNREPELSIEMLQSFIVETTEYEETA